MRTWSPLLLALAAVGPFVFGCASTDNLAGDGESYPTTHGGGDDDDTTAGGGRDAAAGSPSTTATSTTPTSTTTTPPPPPAGSPRLKTIMPERLVDSRDGTGSAPGKFAGKLEAGTEKEISLAGLDALFGPAATRTAYVVHVTATDIEAAGFLAVYPCGTTPEVSALTFAAGEAIGADVVVAGTDKICMKSSVRTNVIIDGLGAFQKEMGSRFTASDPRRVFDSRAGAKATLHMVDVPGLPAGTEGVVAHVTIVDPDGPGYAVAYDCGGQPPTSTLNFAKGEAIGASTFVRVGGGTSLCVATSTPTHAIIDIESSFGSGGTLGFVHRTPVRAFDSRAAAAATTYEFTVPTLPAGAKSAVLSLTATGATVPTFATVHPCGNPATGTSTLNLATGSTRTSLTVAPLSALGAVCVTANAPVHIIADVLGVLAP